MNVRPILKIWTALRAAGPYLLIEVLLPGGTLLALLLWLAQRFMRSGAKTAQGVPRPKHLDALAGLKAARAAEIGPVKPLGAALR
jgi:hypothetical protein